jgi:uncharacterized protein (DUF1330 family)
MKAYLVLDLSVHDLGGFRKYTAEIPAFITKHSGKYIVRGGSQRQLRVIGNPNAWSSSNFQNAKGRKHFYATLKFRTCSRCATIRRRVNWCLPMDVRNRLASEIWDELSHTGKSASFSDSSQF